MVDYRVWLKKALALHAKKRDDAEYNYQESGSPWYYSSQIKHEYYTDALSAALRAIDKRNEGYAAAKMTIAGIHNEAKQWADSMSAQEALDSIMTMLYLESL